MLELTGTEALRATLAHILREDPRALLLGEDIGLYGGAFGVTRGLFNEFGPQRLVETPISEASIVGAGTGMALMGLRPIIEIMFMDFLPLAMDQILNHASKFHFMFHGQVDVPMVVRTPCGAGRGYGPSHSQSLSGMFAHIPGLEVYVPSSPTKMAGLLKTAHAASGPVLFVEHKLIYNRKQTVPFEDAENFAASVPAIPAGQADVVRQGSDVTVVAYLDMVNLAIEAAEELATLGVDVEVLDLQTLSPLDEIAILTSLAKTGRLVVFEEEYAFCSFGSEVACLAASKGVQNLKAPVEKVALPNMPIPAARELECLIMPNKERLMQTIENMLGQTKAVG